MISSEVNDLTVNHSPSPYPKHPALIFLSLFLPQTIPKSIIISIFSYYLVAWGL